jgi:hypothetical protein
LEGKVQMKIGLLVRRLTSKNDIFEVKFKKVKFYFQKLARRITSP